jgi:hypothetical protein
MFDWQADVKAQSSNPNEGPRVASRKFWIYWVISVPLTIVVLLTRVGKNKILSDKIDKLS